MLRVRLLGKVNELFISLTAERAKAAAELAELNAKSEKSTLTPKEQKEFALLTQATSVESLTSLGEEKKQLELVGEDKLSRDQKKRLKELDDIFSYSEQLNDSAKAQAAQNRLFELQSKSGDSGLTEKDVMRKEALTKFVTDTTGIADRALLKVAWMRLRITRAFAPSCSKRILEKTRFKPAFRALFEEGSA